MSVKRYLDLSTEELSSLNEDQIQHYIDVEIAIAGIIPCEPPVLENTPEVTIKPTVNAFECQNVIFMKEDEVLAFSKMETCSEGYNNQAGYNYKYLTPKEEYGRSIKPVTFYSQADVKTLATQLEKANRIKNENKSKSSEWDKYQKDISSITSSVWNAIRDAKEDMNNIQKAQRVFQKHLELAGNDREIAEKFFRDAYKDFDEDWVAKILVSIQ